MTPNEDREALESDNIEKEMKIEAKVPSRDLSGFLVDGLKEVK